jgi:TPP-dependent pyruvate/acetoin dehydrogenase alpha subunit
MGASAVVGTTIPNAVGYAYALKLQKKDSIVVSFFGDGATDEGVFYESLNFAALKQLPIIFICENNFYAIHTHLLSRHKDTDLCGRIRAFGIPAEQIRDNDLFEINERVTAAVSALRARQVGPLFFECLTYRWKEHVGPNDDFHLGYRSYEEAHPWIEKDQVRRVATLIPPESREQIEAQVDEEIQRAFECAEKDAFPEARELLTDVSGD